MPRLTAQLRDVIAIHRLEFPLPVNYACYASWGVSFAVTDARQLAGRPVVIAVAANLLLIVSGLAANSAADVHTDERQRERHLLATAVLRFGRRRAVRWAATEMAVALLLATLASVWVRRPVVAADAVATITLHVLYNTEPVRLKRHGLTGVAAFCASGLVLPFLLGYWTVRPGLANQDVALVAGLGLLAVGRMTLWSIPDRVADAATGMRTPSVRYGPAGTLARSAAIMITGLGLAGWGLWWRYGPALALPLIVTQAVFPYRALHLMCRAGTAKPPSPVPGRCWMPLAAAGTVVLTVVPLLAV
jgi:4-hydroxybenzoate polyprenyltransferase